MKIVPLALLLFVWSSLAFAFDDLFPKELTQFEPISTEPVFTGRGPGFWDEKIRERGWILKEGENWRLWYTGFVPGGPMKLGYAESKDGLKWVRREEPLVEDYWVEDMMVLKRDDGYVMFAEGLNDHAQILLSPDGIKWERLGTIDIRTKDGEEIDRGPYGTPTAWYEDETWYLFYERRDLGVWLATSKDLKVFTNVQDDPVIAIGPGAPDKYQVALNQIVKHQEKYYAFYHGSGSADRPRLWTTNLAVSEDLIHWKKNEHNPLFPAEENKSSGILIETENEFRLYTMHDRVMAHRQKKAK